MCIRACVHACVRTRVQAIASVSEGSRVCKLVGDDDEIDGQQQLAAPKD